MTQLLMEYRQNPCLNVSRRGIFISLTDEMFKKLQLLLGGGGGGGTQKLRQRVRQAGSTLDTDRDLTRTDEVGVKQCAVRGKRRHDLQADAAGVPEPANSADARDPLRPTKPIHHRRSQWSEPNPENPTCPCQQGPYNSWDVVPRPQLSHTTLTKI